jgi:hypothetical protein
VGVSAENRHGPTHDLHGVDEGSHVEGKELVQASELIQNVTEYGRIEVPLDHLESLRVDMWQ